MKDGYYAHGTLIGLTIRIVNNVPTDFLSQPDFGSPCYTMWDQFLHKWWIQVKNDARPFSEEEEDYFILIRPI